MKIGLITVHAAHNYGSVLQAYALQQTCLNMGHKCEIINLRTDLQRDLYNVFSKRKGVRNFVKNIYFLLHYKSRKEKYNKFEQFIEDKFILSEKEYRTTSELFSTKDNYDCFICGSDQIWNIKLDEFEWAYFLSFVKGKKKISYAPSCGGASVVPPEEEVKLKTNLEDFDAISVRDIKTQEFVKIRTKKEPILVLDPALLLGSKEWDELIDNSSTKNVPKDYIFFYSLSSSKETVEIAKMVSKKMGIPVIISRVCSHYDILAGFNKITDSGPGEFLYHIKNAKFVITTSYHATVFSILYQVPFFCVSGLEDVRIGYLLRLLKLENRSISMIDAKAKMRELNKIDFGTATKLLEENRDISLNFLRTNLEG